MRAGTISSVAELCNHNIFIRTVGSYLLLRFGTFNSFLAGLVGAEVECAVHVALPKRQINQIKQVQQSRKKVLLSLMICTVCVTVAEKPRHFDCFILQLVVL